MKKFVSLFVLAAVLAFAGTSFADVKAKVTAIESLDPVADAELIKTVNNGAVTANSTNLYYFGDANAAGDVYLGARFTTASFTGAAKEGIVGFVGSLQYLAGTEPSIGTNVPNGAAYTGTGKFWIQSQKFSELDKLASIGAYAGTDGQIAPDPTNGVDLTIVPTAVTFTPSKDAITFELTDTSASVEIAGAAGTGNTVEFELKADTDEVRVEAPNNAGIKVAIDTTNKKKINITPDAGAFTAGTSTITVALKEATVKEGTLEDILVAGIDNSSGTEVATITVTVLPAATNSADIAGASKIEIVSGDAEGDIVISTDIVSADTAAAKTIVGSTDVLLYGDLPSNFAETSRDVAAATRGGKDYYDVTLKKDDLNTLGVGTYTVFLGNIKQTYPVRTDSVTITVVEPTPPEPPTPSDGGVKEPTAEIVAVVTGNPNVDTSATIRSADVNEARAIMAGMPFAASLDENGKLSPSVAATLVGAQSEDVTPLQAVSADVKASKIAMFPFAINGSSLIDTKSYTRGASPDVLVIRKAKANGTHANFTYAKTADDIKDGSFMLFNEAGDVRELDLVSGDRSYTLVLFVEDRTDTDNFDLDNRAGKILDPVVAVKARPGSSSSSGCDLGFALVAAVGLATLALRRRGK